jgi:isocitrate dehydrogenase (NAD+)
LSDSTTSYQVALLPGDGIGPEVMAAACAVVDATDVPVVWHRFLIGTPAIERGESPLPDEVVEAMRKLDVALKGPVSTPIGRHGFRSVNVALRKALGTDTQVRPSRTFAGLDTPFRNIDLVVIRDTREDIYAGIEFESDSAGAEQVRAVSAANECDGGPIPPDSGISLKLISESASRRIVEFAFRYAREHGRAKVTAVHKATVMRATDGLFLDVAREVARQHPDIEFEDQLVDNVCGKLVQCPNDYDVLVMPNFYGDIISDITAGLTGGIGVSGGVNAGTDHFIFEPAHGTVPKNAGKNVANPVAAILSAAMMLRHLGETGAGDRVEAAVRQVIDAGQVLTYDLRRVRPGPPASTSAFAEAVIAAL